MDRDQVFDDNEDDWENEDPNLLNVPELLYAETEKLPLPEEGGVAVEKDAEVVAAAKILHGLILDNNIAMYELGKQKDLRQSEAVSLEAVTDMADSVELECNKIKKYIEELESMPRWDEETFQSIFGEEGANDIQEWKTSLDQFLQHYVDIRKYIPKESLEQNQQQSQESEVQKEQFNNLVKILKELKTAFNLLEELDMFS